MSTDDRMDTPALKKQIALFILPILYAFFCIHNTDKSPHSFINTVDPEYIHLMSSIHLAEGNISIQSIESPGTPLYVLGAITSKITCLVSSHDPLKQDFIANPEKYIEVLRLVLLILTTFSLYVLGRVVQKISQNPFASILFQLAPFLSLNVMMTSTIITPDHFLIIVMVFYIAVLFRYIHQDPNKDEMKSAIYFSFFTAIGCATKITFLPLVILPLFILPKTKQKLGYVLSTALLSPLFAFTATFQYERFFTWVKGLIFHAGNYGTGEEKIISSTSFIKNLMTIIYTEIPLIMICLLLLVCILLMVIKQKKNQQNKLIFGLFCTFVLHIILVSKHFAIRYLTPSILLGVLGIYLFILLVSNTKKTQKIWLICVIVAYPLASFNRIYRMNDELLNHTKSRTGAHEFLEKNMKGLPLLIVPNYFGSGTKAYALWFASKWIGKDAPAYIDDMNNECPNTYFYIPDEDKYYNWRNEISLFDLLKSHQTLNLYIALDATKLKEEVFGQEILKKIMAYNRPNDAIIKIKYLFHQKYDMICQLTIDTAKLIKTYRFNEAFCDMERITSDKKYYFTANHSRLFKNHDLRTSEKSFSGKFSEKLTKQNPYGTGCTVDNVQVGDYFEATIWKYSDDDDYLLACTATNANDLYVVSNTVVAEKNAWKKIKLTVTIDKKIPGNKLNFYSWYTGKGNCYCDDFKMIMGRHNQKSN